MAVWTKSQIALCKYILSKKKIVGAVNDVSFESFAFHLVGTLDRLLIFAISDELQKRKGFKPQDPNSTACAVVSTIDIVVSTTCYVVQQVDKIKINDTKKKHWWSCNKLEMHTQGWRQEFSDGGADSSDEGAKIWFSGYHKYQKVPIKSLFTFRRGL